METRLERTKQALSKHGFDVRLVASAAEAKQAVLAEIEAGQKVGIGGSRTIDTLDLVPELEAKGCELFWHWQAETPAEADRLKKAQLTADVFLASSNAVTEDGCLVNIDGTGNRVAAMTFGPGKVILVCGQNKVVSDVAAGIERIETVAAPLNARRLNTGTPCGITGSCNDCDSPNRMCSVTSIIKRRPKLTDLKVILVKEELGY